MFDALLTEDYIALRERVARLHPELLSEYDRLRSDVLSHMDRIRRRVLGDPGSDADLAKVILAAARMSATGWFGDNKVFVHHVHRAFQTHNPHLGYADLDAFKRKLTELNWKGLLELSRADLVQLMDPREVQRSEIRVGPAVFNFLYVPKQNGQSAGVSRARSSPSRATRSRGEIPAAVQVNLPPVGFTRVRSISIPSTTGTAILPKKGPVTLPVGTPVLVLHPGTEDTSKDVFSLFQVQSGGHLAAVALDLSPTDMAGIRDEMVVLYESALPVPDRAKLLWTATGGQSFQEVRGGIDAGGWILRYGSDPRKGSPADLVTLGVLIQTAPTRYEWALGRNV